LNQKGNPEAPEQLKALQCCRETSFSANHVVGRGGGAVEADLDFGTKAAEPLSYCGSLMWPGTVISRELQDPAEAGPVREDVYSGGWPAFSNLMKHGEKGLRQGRFAAAKIEHRGGVEAVTCGVDLPDRGQPLLCGEGAGVVVVWVIAVAARQVASVCQIELNVQADGRKSARDPLVYARKGKARKKHSQGN